MKLTRLQIVALLWLLPSLAVAGQKYRLTVNNQTGGEIDMTVVEAVYWHQEATVTGKKIFSGETKVFENEENEGVVNFPGLKWRQWTEGYGHKLHLEFYVAADRANREATLTSDEDNKPFDPHVQLVCGGHALGSTSKLHPERRALIRYRLTFKPGGLTCIEER
jgi:hypothetical protein